MVPIIVLVMLVQLSGDVNPAARLNAMVTRRATSSARQVQGGSSSWLARRDHVCRTAGFSVCTHENQHGSHRWSIGRNGAKFDIELLGKLRPGSTGLLSH